MIKAIIILSILFGLFCYALLAAVGMSADRDAYQNYQEWKKRQEREHDTDCQWK